MVAATQQNPGKIFEDASKRDAIVFVFFQISENTNQNNSKHGHFSRSVYFACYSVPCKSPFFDFKKIKHFLRQ